MRALLQRGKKASQKLIGCQGGELGLAKLIGFNNSRSTHSEIPSVGAHLGDWESRTFRGEPARHHHSAIADREGEAIVMLGNAIIANIL